MKKKENSPYEGKGPYDKDRAIKKNEKESYKCYKKKESICE